MGIDYGSSGNFVKLPKVGEDPKEFKIKECKKVEDPKYKFNFMKKEEVKDKDGIPVMDQNGNPIKAEVNQGYRFVYELEDGSTFSISSWKPFYAFKEADVQDGDHIRVHHPKEGEWRVEKLGGGIASVEKIEDKDIDWDE